MQKKGEFFSDEVRAEIREGADTSRTQILQPTGRMYCVFCKKVETNFDHWIGRQGQKWNCQSSAALDRINQGMEVLYRRKLLKHREDKTNPDPGAQAAYITEHAFLMMRQQNPSFHLDQVVYCPADWLPDQHFYTLQVNRDEIRKESDFKPVNDKTVLQMYEALDDKYKQSYPYTNITSEDIAKNSQDQFYLSPWKMRERMDDEKKKMESKEVGALKLRLGRLEKELKDCKTELGFCKRLLDRHPSEDELRLQQYRYPERTDELQETAKHTGEVTGIEEPNDEQLQEQQYQEGMKELQNRQSTIEADAVVNFMHELGGQIFVQELQEYVQDLCNNWIDKYAAFIPVSEIVRLYCYDRSSSRRNKEEDEAAV